MSALLIGLIGGIMGYQEGPDPLAFERARAKVIRSAVGAVANSIVTIETIGGAQPLAQEQPRPQRPPGGRPNRPGRPGRPGPGAQGPRQESFRLGEGPTTGIVWSPDGLILTSSVNFARAPSIITVTLGDGRRFVAKLLGVDYIRRLALVRIEAADLPMPQWSAPGDAHIGQYVIGCGRGLGAPDPSASLGIISALRRRNGNAVQTDAKTSPINYGGPLVDIEGRVIGLIVPMAGAGGALAGTEWYDSGIGFAVTRDRIDAVVERLIAGEIIEPGKIGVILEPDDAPSLFGIFDMLLPGPTGVRIREVARRSPAATAKLKAGDRIVEFEGVPISDLPELQRRLSDRAAGETVKLKVKRLFRTLDVELTLARSAEISGLSTDEPLSPGDGDPSAPPEGPTSRPSD